MYSIDLFFPESFLFPNASTASYNGFEVNTLTLEYIILLQVITIGTYFIILGCILVGLYSSSSITERSFFILNKQHYKC